MKALRIVYIVLLYLMQACLISAILVLLNDHDILIQELGPVWISAIVIGVTAIFVGITYSIVALISCVKPALHPFRDGLIFKLVMVPFFIANFYLCGLLLGGLLNPWLAWSVFGVIPLVVFLTYLVLLVTSSYSLGMMVRSLITKKGNRGRYGWQIALHLLFVIDVVSAFVIRGWERQEEAERSWRQG
jgi:hypothetical protein